MCSYCLLEDKNELKKRNVLQKQHYCNPIILQRTAEEKIIAKLISALWIMQKLSIKWTGIFYEALWEVENIPFMKHYKRLSWHLLIIKGLYQLMEIVVNTEKDKAIYLGIRYLKYPKRKQISWLCMLCTPE